MTMEQHIEELKIELRNADDQVERAQIRVELELAEAELAVAVAEQCGEVDAEPPFRRPGLSTVKADTSLQFPVDQTSSISRDDASHPSRRNLLLPEVSPPAAFSREPKFGPQQVLRCTSS